MNIIIMSVAYVFFVGVTIGFEQTFYTATEGTDPFVEVCAIVRMGILEREAVVTLSTVDGAAVSVGQSAIYMIVRYFLLSFNHDFYTQFL